MMKQIESSYIGHHAELYDLFYAEKPYAQEAEFVHEFIQANSRSPAKRILDLACGTGNHAFEMEKFGYEIVATDYSADMLAQANSKARRKKSRVQFRQHDMRDFNLAAVPFDVAICLFDSIGYVETNDNILKVFSNLRRHLKPDGLFILEFWRAGAMLRSYEPLRVRRWESPDRKILRISETTIDYRNQLCYVSYTIDEHDAKGLCRVLQETQVNRFFLPKEMELFIEQTGFQALHLYNGYSADEEINETTWHILAVTTREATGE